MESFDDMKILAATVVEGSVLVVSEFEVYGVLADEDVEFVSEENDNDAVLVIWESVVTSVEARGEVVESFDETKISAGLVGKVEGFVEGWATVEDPEPKTNGDELG